MGHNAIMSSEEKTCENGDDNAKHGDVHIA